MKNYRITTSSLMIGILIFVIGLSLPLLPASAQFSLFDSTQAFDISITSTPEYPKPFEEVALSLSSFNFDLDRLIITWFVDNKQFDSGLGIKKIKITAGDVGETTRVEAIVQTQTGETVSKKLNISPGSLDLLWEAVNVYVPPFYKGKALPSRESTIKVIAIPQTKNGEKLLSPKSFKYTWEHDYKNLASRSGFGIDSITFTNRSTNRSETVGVLAVNATGSLRTSSRITIPLFEPEVILYKESALGRSVHAITSGISTGDPQITIVAEPYFFSVAGKTLWEFEYEWRDNLKKLTAPGGEPIGSRLVLQHPGIAGKSSISVKVIHPFNYFQEALGGLDIIFN